MNPILERDPNDPQKDKKEAVNPVLKLVLELGPLLLFFFANTRGEWLAAKFPVLTGLGGPIFIATGLFMAATALALAASWLLTRTLPLMPLVGFLAVRGASTLGTPAAAGAGVLLAVWSLAVGVPVLKAYAAEPSPASRVVAAMRDEVASHGQPGALALHQAFRRPFEAEDVPVANVLSAPAAADIVGGAILTAVRRRA